ncbi:hypothetical protein GW17_00060207, partial [Ensete ventricosum]
SAEKPTRATTQLAVVGGSSGEGAGSDGTSMAGRGGLVAAVEEAKVALFLLDYGRRLWQRRRATVQLAMVGDNRGEGAGSEGDLNGRKRRLRAAATTMIAAIAGRRSRLGYGSGSRVQDLVEGDRDHGEEMMLAVVQ